MKLTEIAGDGLTLMICFFSLQSLQYVADNEYLLFIEETNAYKINLRHRTLTSISP